MRQATGNQDVAVWLGHKKSPGVRPGQVTFGNYVEGEVIVAGSTRSLAQRLQVQAQKAPLCWAFRDAHL